MKNSLYDFNVKNISGQEESLTAYKGKVVIVVNVASQCGYTPQYKELETLYKKYKEQGLVILGFPCNQFGSQEPGTEADIKAFCELNFGVTFPLYAKVDVNGAHAAPLFDYLKTEKPGLLGSKIIKWNFTKFLINKEGKPVARYAPKDSPDVMVKDIEKLLRD